jgi:hypothetical protein
MYHQLQHDEDPYRPANETFIGSHLHSNEICTTNHSGEFTIAILHPFSLIPSPSFFSGN